MTLFQPKNDKQPIQKIARITAILATVVSLVYPGVSRAQINTNSLLISQNSAISTVETTTTGLHVQAPSVDQAIAASQDDVPPSVDSALTAPDETASVVLTAFTSTPDQTDDTPCITADGTDVCTTKIPTVAANWLPFGTKVKIPSLFGDKVFEVHDRMNKRYGRGRMDIWFDTSKAEAFKFGIKRATVEIYLADASQ